MKELLNNQLLWKSKDEKLEIYGNQNGALELETSITRIPFADKHRLLVYLQERYQIQDDDYREVYRCCLQHQEHVHKQMQENKISETSADIFYDTSLSTGKEVWKEQARQNREDAKDKIIKLAEDFKTDPTMIGEYLQFSSRFYSYSTRNTMLIFSQNPHATFVQSFDSWKEMDASVKKGEHGLKIFFPVFTTFLQLGENQEVPLSKATKQQKADYKAGKLSAEKRLTNFRIGNVFDISQTTYPKEDYPKLFHMGYADVEHRMLCTAVANYCRETLGCDVSYENNVNSISLRGSYSRLTNTITINPLLEDTQRLSTLTHEMAHAMVHSRLVDSPGFQKEFEADALSIMFLSDFGISPTEQRLRHLSDNYKRLVTYLEKQQEENPEIEVDTDKQIGKIFAPVFKVYEQHVEGFYRSIQESIDMQQFLSEEFQSQSTAYAKDLQELLRTEYEDQEYSLHFLQEDYLQGGMWASKELKKLERSAAQPRDRDTAGKLLERLRNQQKTASMSKVQTKEIGKAFPQGMEI